MDRPQCRLVKSGGEDADVRWLAVACAEVPSSLYDLVAYLGAFDDAGEGAMSAGRVEALADLVNRFGDRSTEALRGKSPPGW